MVFRLVTVRHTAIAAALLIAACGPSAPETPRLVADCDGAYCASAGDRYQGPGVGVWRYLNRSGSTQQLPVQLAGLTGQTVTLVLSNLGDQPRALPAAWTGHHTPQPMPPTDPAVLNDPFPTDRAPALDVPEQHRIWQVPQIGAQHQAAGARDLPATLRGLSRIDGFAWHVWVADEDWNAPMQQNLATIAALLFGTPSYEGLLPQTLADLGAAPWGPYPATPHNADLVPAGNRDIHILFAPTGAPGLQFFDSGQAYRRAGSNGALMVFADSATFACRNMPAANCRPGLRPPFAFVTANTLLHEIHHLIGFYQRDAARGENQRFDTWLEEAFASSRGYLTAISRFPRTPAFLQEFWPWFSGKYACPLVSAEGAPGSSVQQPCAQNYYSSGQAFLVYLAHQYGTGIHRQLLQAAGRGIDGLDQAIRASGGPGFEESFRRWGGALALRGGGPWPAGLGYPGTPLGGHAVPPLDPRDFAGLLQVPDTLPDTIAPHSHLLLEQENQHGDYRRQLQVPPDVAATFYVQ